MYVVKAPCPAYPDMSLRPSQALIAFLNMLRMTRCVDRAVARAVCPKHGVTDDTFET
jgi:hypothetical protein